MWALRNTGSAETHCQLRVGCVTNARHFAMRNYFLPIRKSTYLRREINGTYVVSKMSQTVKFLIANYSPSGAMHRKY